MVFPNTDTRTIATADLTVGTPMEPNKNGHHLQTTPTPDRSDEEESSYHSQSQLLRNTVNTSKGGSSFILMKKTTLFFVGFLLLAFVGAFGYFFSEWLYQREFSTANNGDKANCFLEGEVECPFSQNDVDNLSAEIDRLENLNKQLSNQLDDYEDLNNRLNESVTELKRQNEVLSESNDLYEDLNDRLNNTVAELKEQNHFLKEQVDTFAGLNQDLNSTVIDLKDEVDRLEGEVTNFTAENNRLEDLVNSLSNETDALTDLSNVLQENVDRLKGQVGNLQTENSRLESSIDDLKTVVGFWNDVAGDWDDTYEKMAAFLAQQISTNRFLVLEALQNTYHQRVADWDCGLRSKYALEPFAQDDSVTIPNDKYSDVISFVDERVLSDLCLSRSNFESYLAGRYSSGDISIDRLITGVRRYTWDAIDHYFPENGEEGVAAEDWATAMYSCDNLMPSQKYSV